MADVTIDPGRAGRVTATIRVTHEDSTPFPAKAVTLRSIRQRPAAKPSSADSRNAGDSRRAFG